VAILRGCTADVANKRKKKRKTYIYIFDYYPSKLEILKKRQFSPNIY